MFGRVLLIMLMMVLPVLTWVPWIEGMVLIEATPCDFEMARVCHLGSLGIIYLFVYRIGVICSQVFNVQAEGPMLWVGGL